MVTVRSWSSAAMPWWMLASCCKAARKAGPRDVGAALRSALREHRASSGPTERRSPRPHIRSAHWHAYWAGPRADPDKRRIILHWLPPIPVNMGGLDEIIPTIRQVKRKRKKEESQS